MYERHRPRTARSDKGLSLLSPAEVNEAAVVDQPNARISDACAQYLARGHNSNRARRLAGNQVLNDRLVHLPPDRHTRITVLELRRMRADKLDSHTPASGATN